MVTKTNPKEKNDMQEPYQDDTYQDTYYPAPEPRKGMSGWLIALIVVLVLVVMCCLCLCLVLLLAGPSIGNTFSTIIEDIITVTPLP
jgi:hypothetical protein